MPDGLILSKLILSGHERDQGISDTLLEAARLKQGNHPSIIPDDKGLMSWIYGRRVTYEKGIISDSVWKIEPGEISGFRVNGVTQNQADRVYSANVSFKATAQGKGIQVSEALIRYKKRPSSDVLEFVDFVVVGVSRLGS